MDFEVKGFEKLVHPETGEKYSVLMNTTDRGGLDLNRIILKQMINALNLKYKRLDIANWIIDNLDSNYCMYASQKYIADTLGCGIKTVYYTIKVLQEQNILQKMEELRCYGYRINPLLLCHDKDITSIGICYKINE